MSDSVHEPSSYAAVLRTPGVAVLGLGAAVASLPIGFLGLAVLLVTRERGDGFAVGGVAVATLGLGAVAGMLVQGRLMDRLGGPVVLLPAAAVRTVAGAALLAADRVPVTVEIGLIALVGCGEPQVSNALRTALPRMVEPGLRSAAAAVSALLFELPVLLGPLLMTALLVVGTPSQALLLGLFCSTSGACLFASSRGANAMRVDRPPVPHGARPRRPAGIPVVRTSAVIVAVQGFAVGSAQVASVARASTMGSAADAGLLYAALTAGSLIGTAVAGTRSGRTAELARATPLMLGLAAASAATAAAPTTVLLGAALFAFGLCAGPLVLGCFVAVERAAPAASPTAAVTLLVAAGLLATSMGAAAAGWLVDARSASTPLLLAAGLLVTSAAVSTRAHRAAR